MNNLWNHQTVRFASVGLLNTLLDLVFFNILVHLFGLNIVLANSISVSFGIVLSYILNKRFVFNEKHTWRAFLLFVCVTGMSSLIIQDLVIWITKDSFDILAKITADLLSLGPVEPLIRTSMSKLCAVAVGMVWNFTLYKYLVFRKIEPKQVAEV